MWGIYQDGKGLISKHKTYKAARTKWDKLVQKWTRKTGGSRFTGNNPYWVEEIKPNPPKSKWIPTKAVRFNKDGSVSMRGSRFKK